MTWSVILPFKGRAERKTRLAGRLTGAERQALSASLFDHAVRTLQACPTVGEIILLSDLRPAGWTHRFLPDHGRGLNAELAAAVGQMPTQRILILLPDLPLLSVADVEAMLEDSDRGCSIAADRAGTGTNALAFQNATNFTFAFGPNSFIAHVQASRWRARFVTRPGLALDIDTSADLDAAASLGFESPDDCGYNIPGDRYTSAHSDCDTDPR
jgi:2-phospho-L-lactate/phosphoenolpyruvate guanylyltransferase